MLARLAEPGRRAVGLPRRERRRAAASRLRPRRPPAAPRRGGVAERRRDRHLTLPSRPLGRRRPVGVGRSSSAPRPTLRIRSSGCRRAAARRSRASASSSGSRRCSRTRSSSTSTRAAPRSRRRGNASSPTACCTTRCSTFGFRVSANGHARVLGRQRPDRRARLARARCRSLSLRGDAAQAESRGRHARPSGDRRGGRGVPRFGRKAAAADAPPGRTAARGRFRAGVRRLRARTLGTGKPCFPR